MAEHEDILTVQKELSHDFPMPIPDSKQTLLNSLANSINHLIEADFLRLVSILYRLDISESKLKKTLEENTGSDAGMLIATLVIERQLQKIHSRATFKQQGDIPDDEKW